MRKTLTNIKRGDRKKATMILIALEILIVSLFCYFGIAKTTHANELNTTVITSTIDDFKHVDISGGRINTDYFKIYSRGEEYHVGSGMLTLDAESFSVILKKSPNARIVVDKDKNVVDLYIGEINYCKQGAYNQNQDAKRTTASVLLFVTEIIVVPSYVLYIILHRTSKDKKRKSK